MGGICSKDDTSFLIMCSSFLFPPINIWGVFIGSQFSSEIPHMALQHRCMHSIRVGRETLLETGGKQPPAPYKS